MIVYDVIHEGYWGGRALEVADKAPIPNGWTLAAPPAHMAEGQFARLGPDMRFTVTDQPPPPPAPPAPTTPLSVSAASAQIALFEAGLLPQVEAAVAAHRYEPVRIWYAKANNWLRSHAYLNGLGAELGLSEERIDELFTAAAKIDGTPF